MWPIACKFFTSIIAQDPSYSEAWNRRATLRYMMHQYQGSLEDIEETLKLEPRHFGALSGRGMVNLALERFDDAVASFQAAGEVNPHMDNQRNVAAALAAKHRKDQQEGTSS